MSETVTDIVAELERNAAEPERANVQDVIYSMAPELMRSLGDEQACEALSRHYFNAIRYTPQLRACTAESIVGALLLSAQVRLEPGPLGHVYLIPRRRKGVWEVQWLVGYTGLIALGRRGGAVGLRATLVYTGDTYTPPWQNEKGLHYEHRPASGDRGERAAVLVTWKEAGERMALDCPAERIHRAQQASASYQAGAGPWLTDPDAMWRKTGVRFARPWLPLTTELGRATAADESTVYGVTVEDGTATPEMEASEQ